MILAAVCQSKIVFFCLFLHASNPTIFQKIKLPSLISFEINVDFNEIFHEANFKTVH